MSAFQHHAEVSVEYRKSLKQDKTLYKLGLRTNFQALWTYLFISDHSLIFLKGKKNHGGHSFSTYAKFSENLTFLTLWYPHVRVRVSF